MNNAIAESNKTYRKQTRIFKKNCKTKHWANIISKILKFYSIYIFNTAFLIKTIYCTNLDNCLLSAEVSNILKELENKANEGAQSAIEFENNLKRINSLEHINGVINVEEVIEVLKIKDSKNKEYSCYYCIDKLTFWVICLEIHQYKFAEKRSDTYLNTTIKSLIESIKSNAEFRNCGNNLKILSTAKMMSKGIATVMRVLNYYHIVGTFNNIALITEEDFLIKRNLIKIKYSTNIISAKTTIDELKVLALMNQYKFFDDNKHPVSENENSIEYLFNLNDIIAYINEENDIDIQDEGDTDNQIDEDDNSGNSNGKQHIQKVGDVELRWTTNENQNEFLIIDIGNNIYQIIITRIYEKPSDDDLKKLKDNLNDNPCLSMLKFNIKKHLKRL